MGQGRLFRIWGSIEAAETTTLARTICSDKVSRIDIFTEQERYCYPCRVQRYTLNVTAGNNLEVAHDLRRMQDEQSGTQPLLWALRGKTRAHSCRNQIESTVEEGKSSINTTVAQAQKDVAAIRGNADDLGKQMGRLRSDISGYTVVNGEMRKMQEQFHGQTNDLSKLDLRVHTLETVASGPESEAASQLGLKNLGCQATHYTEGAKVVPCAQGSPPIFYQRTGEVVRPVSSMSSIGFQDTSTSPRPACGVANRGTFYIEKGEGKNADKPLLCSRKSDHTYDWIQIAVVP